MQWAGNGHFYELIVAETTWAESDSAASNTSYSGISGRLATVTSAEENAFIADVLGSYADGRYWLGGFQPPGTPEPADGWEWVTGETWDYTNWATIRGAPNNSGGEEDGLLMYLEQQNPLWFGQWNSYRHP